MLLHVLEVHKTQRNRTFAKPCMCKICTLAQSQIDLCLGIIIGQYTTFMCSPLPTRYPLQQGSSLYNFLHDIVYQVTILLRQIPL